VVIVVIVVVVLHFGIPQIDAGERAGSLGVRFNVGIPQAALRPWAEKRQIQRSLDLGHTRPANSPCVGACRIRHTGESDKSAAPESASKGTSSWCNSRPVSLVDGGGTSAGAAAMPWDRRVILGLVAAIPGCIDRLGILVTPSLTQSHASSLAVIVPCIPNIWCVWVGLCWGWLFASAAGCDAGASAQCSRTLLHGFWRRGDGIARARAQMATDAPTRDRESRTTIGRLPLRVNRDRSPRRGKPCQPQIPQKDMARMAKNAQQLAG